MNLKTEWNIVAEVLRARKNIFNLRFDAYLLTEGKEVPFASAFITINAKKLIQNYENKKIREVFNIIKLK